MGGINAQDLQANRDVVIVHGNYGSDSPAAARGRHGPCQLQRDPGLTGRDHELDELERLIRNGAAGAAISGARLHGLGGVGKTALAVALAHRLRDCWPDAQLVVRLRGADPDKRPPLTTIEAMTQVIVSLRPEAKPPGDTDALTNAYLACLTDAGCVLLLLDDAADAAQVRPLLPPKDCLLLVTSRLSFHLPDLASQRIDCLPPDKSREFLLRHAPRLGDAAADAAELCGHLPLALQVFAGTANEQTSYTPAELLVELRRHAGLEKVDAAFALSYDLLSEAMRRRWALLSIFGASFRCDAAAAVWEEEPAPAKAAMQSLMNSNLVEFDAESGRYRLHDLVRQFCAGKLSAEEADAARLRHAGHYIEVAWSADALYKKNSASVVQGLALFDAERAHLDAAFAWLSTHPDHEAARGLIRLVNAVVYTGDLRFHPRERIRWLEAQRDAARVTGNRHAEGNALGNLGNAHAALGDARTAIGFHEQHREIAREIGDRRGEGNALGNLGNAHYSLGDARTAIGLQEQNLDIAREIGDRRGEGNALGNLGNAHYSLGDAHTAIDFYEQRLVIAREIGDRRGEGNALGNLGNAHYSLGDARTAIGFYEQHRDIAREIGDRRGEGNALGNLGNAHAALGDARTAIGFYEQRLVIAREIGDRRGEGIALWNSADEFWKLGEQVEAIARAEASLVLKEAIEDPSAAKVRVVLARWRGEEG